VGVGRMGGGFDHRLSQPAEGGRARYLAADPWSSNRARVHGRQAHMGAQTGAADIANIRSVDGDCAAVGS